MSASQCKGLKRNIIDKYYTKDEVVEICLHYIRQHVEINGSDLVIEPSAGNGSFIQGIKEIANHYHFYDLEPENDEIVEQDYLELDFNDIRETYSKIHIIGNPPFGRQSSLAKKFIKKSCQFCDTISFILPKSFKKESLKKTFATHFHLIFEVDIDEKSFLVNGEEYDVPCVFQIWKKEEIERTTIKKMEPIHFTFVKKEENPDISFRRVGANAGKIDSKINDKSFQSHYFIKFQNEKSIADNINILSSIKYDFNNTVGPKSISKQEVIQKFNPLL